MAAKTNGEGKKRDDTRPARGARRGRTIIQLPGIFSLTDNYDAVIEAIDGIRGCGGLFSINFGAMTSISVAAALMLAAEIDICVRSESRTNNTKSAKTLKVWGDEWHKNAGIPLREMGFFDLLKIKPAMRNARGHLGEVFVKFTSGVEAEGNGAIRIIERVEKVFAVEKIPPEIRMPMLAGMGEAILNTNNHAYKDRTSDLSRWWISASVNRHSNLLKVICYDRGRTIPRTIVGSPLWESIKENLGGKEERDENVIRAAMETQKTSTKKGHRGYGLQELRDIIDANNQGVMEVYSRNGMVEYTKKPGDEDATFAVRRLSRELRGTLIVWSIIPDIPNLLTEEP